MSGRGEEIRFAKGKYMGYMGWINLAGDETAASVPVIVQGFRKKDGSTCDKPATVRRESVRPRALPEPKSRSEACIQQHPDIEQTLEKLARQLARCEINPLSAAIQKIFVAKLQEATPRQIVLGHKAIWKRVRYRNRAGGSESL
jgi:hypothetical protein